jgi:hypothetical protein
VPRDPLPIRFSLDGHPLAGETLHSDAGAQVLVLTSCSAELGIELRSAYLGGEGRGELLVAESAVLGAGPAELSTRRLEAADADAHTYERRRLLYDHLQRLQDVARAGGWALGFEGIDAAAAQLDPIAL